MTPAEIAVLREQLGTLRTRHRCLAEGIVGAEVHCVAADGFDAALALLDAHAAEIARLTAERELAHQGLIWAMQQFQHYAVLHHAKGPEGLAKARANELAAQRCREAMAPAPAAEVAG